MFQYFSVMASAPSVSVGIPTFSGSSASLARFSQDFKTFSLLQGWDEVKQASLLPLCLSGVARDAYDCLPESQKKSVALAFEGLKQAFPSRGFIEAQVQLRSLKFDSHSDLDAFIIQLKGLVCRSYPDADRQGLLFNYFLQSLPPHFQCRIVSDGTTSFEAAVATVRNMCCAARLTGQPSQVRQVRSETEFLRQRVGELESQLAKLQGPDGRRGAGGRTCYCCGNSGHLRSVCRHRRATCYQCGTVGHLARACRAGVSENPNRAAGSVPPVRPVMRQGAAGPPLGTRHPPVLSGQGPSPTQDA